MVLKMMIQPIRLDLNIYGSCQWRNLNFNLNFSFDSISTASRNWIYHRRRWVAATGNLYLVCLNFHGNGTFGSTALHVPTAPSRFPFAGVVPHNFLGHVLIFDCQRRPRQQIPMSLALSCLANCVSN